MPYQKKDTEIILLEQLQEYEKKINFLLESFNSQQETINLLFKLFKKDNKLNHIIFNILYFLNGFELFFIVYLFFQK